MSVLRRAERQNLKDMRKGSRRAYEAVVSQHYQSIYSFMVYLSRNTSLAEDLTQETFVSAWSNIDNFNGHATLKTWFHQIAYHKFIDSQRQTKRETDLKSKLNQRIADFTETQNPLYKLMKDEHSILLHMAIQKLKPYEYLLIVLHYFQGLSFRQMDKVLDEPIGTIKWRTSKALKKLKYFLTDRAE